VFAGFPTTDLPGEGINRPVLMAGRAQEAASHLAFVPAVGFALDLESYGP
jgi:hypothetical protein